jgi:hypothetical protein
VYPGVATASAVAWNQPTFDGGYPPGSSAIVPGIAATATGHRPGATGSNPIPGGVASNPTPGA